MTTVTATVRRASLAALALVAVAAPAALADRPSYPQDDNIWATSVPAGQTEHGVWTAGNVNDPHDWFFRRNEYWATADRWYETVTDRAGHLIAQSVSGPEGTTSFLTPLGQRAGPGDHARSYVPKVWHSAHPDLPPFPSYGATYNGELIASRVFVALSPPQQQTIAGFTGTVYELNFGGPHKHTVETVVLQDGTLQPLMREDKIAHPGGGGPALDFQNRMRSRETVPSSAAAVQLTHRPTPRPPAGWRAKVKAAKAKKAKAGNTHHTKAKKRAALAPSPGPCPSDALTSDALLLPGLVRAESWRGRSPSPCPAAPARRRRSPRTSARPA